MKKYSIQQNTYEAIKILEVDEFGAIAVLPNILTMIYNDAEQYKAACKQFQIYINEFLEKFSENLNQI